MRCLYCGNELALLKKLTGYGEFCSEAHRQKYEEQYNRLALSRLLQAHDEPERRAPLSRSSARPGPRNPTPVTIGQTLPAPGLRDQVPPPFAPQRPKVEAPATA